MFNTFYLLLWGNLLLVDLMCELTCYEIKLVSFASPCLHWLDYFKLAQLWVVFRNGDPSMGPDVFVICWPNANPHFTFIFIWRLVEGQWSSGMNAGYTNMRWGGRRQGSDHEQLYEGHQELELLKWRAVKWKWRDLIPVLKWSPWLLTRKMPLSRNRWETREEAIMVIQTIGL